MQRRPAIIHSRLHRQPVIMSEDQKGARKMTRRFIILTAVLSTIAAIALFWFGSRNSAAVAPLLLDRQEDGFHYRVVAEDDRVLRIEVDYQTNSVAGILGYKKAIVQRSAQYAAANPDKQITADITLIQPLSVDQFGALSNDYNLQPLDAVIRIIDSNGQRATISGALKQGEGIAEIQDAITRLTLNGSGSSSVKGVIAFRTTLSGSTYTKLAASGNVFLVDALESDLKDQAVGLRANQEYANIKYVGKNPYWYMEDLGLENFR